MLIPGLLALPAGAGRTDAATPDQKPSPKRPVPRKAVAVTRPSAARPPALCHHVVRPGETLFRIALGHRLKPQTLANANGISDPHQLRVGQRLVIPGCEVATPRIVSAPGASIPARRLPAGGRGAQPVEPRRVYAGDVSPTVEFVSPVDGPVLSGFGQRRGGWHAGVDIRAARGSPIRAAAPGVVVFSGWASFYGNVVKIKHRDGYLTIYAHNLQNLVQVGQEVDTDTVIGTVGRTGRASADHVHFEIRRHDVAYDPVPLLDPREAPSLLAKAPDVWPPDDLLPVSSLALDRRGAQ
jgi:murein DD-endopeptidase MepM/ murein hydrolase activator NlpD